MAHVSHRGSSRRRTISEINMVPFIDVMLVLLIIFMVTAPLITTGVVDLPSVGTSQKRAERVMEVLVAADASLKLRVDGKEPSRATIRDIVARARAVQAAEANSDTKTAVVISADRSVKYEAVVAVMDQLQRNGIQRIGLSVKNVAN